MKVKRIPCRSQFFYCVVVPGFKIKLSDLMMRVRACVCVCVCRGLCRYFGQQSVGLEETRSKASLVAGVGSNFESMTLGIILGIFKPGTSWKKISR